MLFRSTLPIKKSQIFTTSGNFQTSVEIHVLQGEREMAKSNKTLGKFKLKGIRRAPRGVPQIEVSFSIDANGIVNVSAKDLGTGKEQNINITATSNLSQSEIDQAILDAKKFSVEDTKNKEEATIKDQVEQVIYKASTLMKKLDKNDSSVLKESVKNTKKVLKSKDKTQMVEACNDLSKVVEEMEQKLPHDDISNTTSNNEDNKDNKNNEDNEK